jgi:hypothetical protein
MSDSRPAVRLFGLPPWLWVVGSLLLVIVGLYGSLWLPELRERMALRYLRGLPGCEIEMALGGLSEPPRLPFVPDHEWLGWAHRFAPPHPEMYSVTISREFPLAELRRLSAIREIWTFDATGTEFGDEHASCLRFAIDLALDGTRITDAGLAQVLFLDPRSLSVANTRVTDTGFIDLHELRSLNALNLSGTSISRAGLEGIARATSSWRFEELSLSRTSIDDDAMAVIAKMSDLRVLDLSDTKITDVGLARLAAMPSEWTINGLFLDRTRIGDEGLRALFSRVEPDDFSGISLSGTNVTWEYIETWKSAPSVLRLAGLDIRDRAADWFIGYGRNCIEADLSDTRLTDVGLVALENCVLLRRVCVKDCAISEAAAIHFMESVRKVHDLRSTWPSHQTPPPLVDRIREYRETGWLGRQ